MSNTIYWQLFKFLFINIFLDSVSSQPYGIIPFGLTDELYGLAYMGSSDSLTMGYKRFYDSNVTYLA